MVITNVNIGYGYHLWLLGPWIVNNHYIFCLFYHLKFELLPPFAVVLLNKGNW